MAWQGRTVFTGVFKDPVTGPRRVRKLNIDGDGQGDLAGHGGEQRAVFVYQIEADMDARVKAALRGADVDVRHGLDLAV